MNNMISIFFQRAINLGILALITAACFFKILGYQMPLRWTKQGKDSLNLTHN